MLFTIVHFISNFLLNVHWFEDHLDKTTSVPRSISVGLTPDMPMTFDRLTGMAEGL